MLSGDGFSVRLALQGMGKTGSRPSLSGQILFSTNGEKGLQTPKQAGIISRLNDEGLRRYRWVCEKGFVGKDADEAGKNEDY
jgi:hypothetical protein